MPEVESAVAENAAPKTEYWTNPDGREIPTRDALPSEAMSIGMYEEDLKVGTQGDPYDCAVACKMGELDNVDLRTPERRREYGLKIGHKVAVIPVKDADSPVGYVRLRFFRRRGDKTTQKFDAGEKAPSTFVHLIAKTESEKPVAVKKAQKKHREKKKAGKAKKTAKPVTRAPIRAGFREHTHTV